MGVALFIISEVFFFISVFFNSGLAIAVELSAQWELVGISTLNMHNPEVILLSSILPSSVESENEEEGDYNKEPDYTGRIATVTTNYDPRRKNGEGKSKSYPLVPLSSEDHLPFIYYSALMGLLASSGARLEHGPNWWWYLDSKVLRFTSTNLDWLNYVTDIFRKYFEFDTTPTIHSKASGSFKYVSSSTRLCLILWCHWNDRYIEFLPLHFEYYFSVYTLAFWAMRNGQWTNKKFIIYVGRLSERDKKRLINIMQAKLGLESKLIRNGKILSITDGQRAVAIMYSIFHGTQKHRLEKLIGYKLSPLKKKEVFLLARFLNYRFLIIGSLYIIYIL